MLSSTTQSCFYMCAIFNFQKGIIANFEFHPVFILNFPRSAWSFMGSFLWVCHCNYQTCGSVSCHLSLGQLFLCPGPHSSCLSSWEVCKHPFKPAYVLPPCHSSLEITSCSSLAFHLALWLSLRSILATDWSSHVGVFSPPSDYENFWGQLHLRLCMQ